MSKRFLNERTVEKFKVAGIASWSAIGALILIYVGARVVGQIGMVLRPFVFAAIIVVLLKPILDYLEGRNMNRVLALALAYVFFFLLIAIVLVFLIPIAISEVNELISAIPGYQGAIAGAVDSLQTNYRTFSVSPQVTKAIDSALQSGETATINVLSRVPGYTVSVISLLLDFVLSPLIAFFVLKDRAALSRGFFRMVPEAWRPESMYLAYRMNIVMQDVLRIMFLLAVLISVLASAGLMLAGIPYAILLGVIVGFLQIIPYIGPVAGTIPAIIVAWVTNGGWTALGVGIYFTVLTQVSSVLLTPIMMKDKVGVNPVLMLFVLLLFGSIFGFWGVALAVPAAAVINEIASFMLMDELERSQAIRGLGISVD
jgi:predicted PurR-regulated permease PerM